ncbi:MAG: HNH endonuclease, partial [Cyanobium sp.]
MGQVLVLNASYEPLNITTWRRAMVMLLKGKAEGLEHDPARR